MRKLDLRRLAIITMLVLALICVLAVCWIISAPVREMLGRMT